MRIAVIGGTGRFGTALATRLVAAGYEVVVGSRDPERARAAGARVGAEGESNVDAARSGDLVVLAVKADAAVDIARTLREVIGRKPVLAVASELRFATDGVRPCSEAVSVSERIQAELDAPVVAGLHSLAVANLGASELPDEDALVCGDDPEAKAMVLELAARLVAGRAVDAGPLASARTLEGLTAVLVNVNRRYRAHAGIKLTGLA